MLLGIINVVFPPLGSVLELYGAKSKNVNSYLGGAFGTWTGFFFGLAVVILLAGLSVLSFGALPAAIGVSVGVLWACSMIGRGLGFASEASKDGFSGWSLVIAALVFGLTGSLPLYSDVLIVRKEGCGNSLLFEDTPPASPSFTSTEQQSDSRNQPQPTGERVPPLSSEKTLDSCKM